ncbi:hypothetical protein PENSUB_12496 [Penicillium subrubescens]|uniref:Amidase domain-containing protein n=1 Tax=Penicillium subrubescens TaxID=1316194 RepID=A0A1Q5SZL1_9EURO|nr:hypothetical protein PENSUB_12496 [Penicillium subrubescens]
MRRWMEQSSSEGLMRTLGANSGKVVDVLTIDAKGLQRSFERGDVTSLDLVKQYLAQIQRHDSKLHAMIQMTPNDLLEARAKLLDQERAAGKTRGPLHGIPIIIKDNVATHPNFGLPTSAGSFALLSSKPRNNAKIIDQVCLMVAQGQGNE